MNYDLYFHLFAVVYTTTQPLQFPKKPRVRINLALAKPAYQSSVLTSKGKRALTVITNLLLLHHFVIEMCVLLIIFCFVFFPIFPQPENVLFFTAVEKRQCFKFQIQICVLSSPLPFLFAFSLFHLVVCLAFFWLLFLCDRFSLTKSKLLCSFAN